MLTTGNLFVKDHRQHTRSETEGRVAVSGTKNRIMPRLKLLSRAYTTVT